MLIAIRLSKKDAEALRGDSKRIEGILYRAHRRAGMKSITQQEYRERFSKWLS